MVFNLGAIHLPLFERSTRSRQRTAKLPFVAASMTDTAFRRSTGGSLDADARPGALAVPGNTSGTYGDGPLSFRSVLTSRSGWFALDSSPEESPVCVCESDTGQRLCACSSASASFCSVPMFFSMVVA